MRQPIRGRGEITPLAVPLAAPKGTEPSSIDWKLPPARMSQSLGAQVMMSFLDELADGSSRGGFESGVLNGPMYEPIHRCVEFSRRELSSSEADVHRDALR